MKLAAKDRKERKGRNLGMFLSHQNSAFDLKRATVSSKLDSLKPGSAVDGAGSELRSLLVTIFTTECTEDH